MARESWNIHKKKIFFIGEVASNKNWKQLVFNFCTITDKKNIHNNNTSSLEIIKKEFLKPNETVSNVLNLKYYEHETSSRIISDNFSQIIDNLGNNKFVQYDFLFGTTYLSLKILSSKNYLKLFIENCEITFSGNTHSQIRFINLYKALFNNLNKTIKNNLEI